MYFIVPRGVPYADILSARKFSDPNRLYDRPITVSSYCTVEGGGGYDSDTASTGTILPTSETTVLRRDENTMAAAEGNQLGDGEGLTSAVTVLEQDENTMAAKEEGNQLGDGGGLPTAVTVKDGVFNLLPV